MSVRTYTLALVEAGAILNNTAVRLPAEAPPEEVA
jgi:hypothetical protein